MRKNQRIMVGGGAVCCLLFLAAGCSTTPTEFDSVSDETPSVAGVVARDGAVATTVGRPVAELVAAAKAAGARCEFYTPDSQKLEELPAKAPGSVSVHAADGSGQDNYTFDADGVVKRHQRSYGADYGAGVWKDVP